MDREDVVYFIRRLDVEKTKKLSLSNKDIDELPAEIGRLKNLQHLDLSYNNIQNLPPELFQLKKLETLLLFRNRIEAIPRNIGMLSNLILLDVSYNMITKLPAEIGLLENLKTFDAGHCKIKALPLEFINLLSLKDLYLEENPLEFPPAKVVMRGLYATMYHLAQEKKKIEAAKVIVQVYNIPEEIQNPFKQYIECFNDVISNANQKEIQFDIKFINRYLQDDIELDVGVENYLYDFLKFIKDNLDTIKNTKDMKGKGKLSIFDLQVVELRNEITNLNNSLKEKMDEIKSIQSNLNKFTKLLEGE